MMGVCKSLHVTHSIMNGALYPCQLFALAGAVALVGASGKWDIEALEG